MSLRALVALGVCAGLFGVAISGAGCCEPKGQQQLLATVIDEPSNQIIPEVSFSGAAKYAVCDAFYGDLGAGGGGQTRGPCKRWRVYALDAGGTIVIAAKGYEAQSLEVPKADLDACGVADEVEKTFRMERSPDG